MELLLWRRVEHLDRVIDASNQQHGERVRLFVEFREDEISGWGEVSPLVHGLLGDPGVMEVQEELYERASANVLGIVQRESQMPPWSRVHLLGGGSVASRWAYAAIEMAMLDFELVVSNESLIDYWKVDDRSVEVMVTTSAVNFDPEWRPTPLARRVRLKTAPDVAVAPVCEVVGAWGVPILLDFNGSAGTSDVVFEQVRQLGSVVEIVAVEQPFAPGDLASHAELSRTLEVPVALDEGVRTLLDIRRIARYGAASLVCVKPPRLGGVAVARAALSEALQFGLRVYVGGFFESPLARRAHLAVAAGFAVEPSDVAQVGTQLAGGYVERPVGIGVSPTTVGLELLKRIVVR